MINKKIFFIIVFLAALASCSPKVVTVERWARDTVTVGRVATVTQYQRDTVTITEHTEATVERIRVDTVGRPVLFERVVYRNIGTTAAGTVQREVVHDTITIAQGSGSHEATKQQPASRWSWSLALSLALLFSALIYALYKRLYRRM